MNPPPKRSGIPVFWIVLAVIAVLGIVGIVVASSGSDDDTSSTSASSGTGSTPAAVTEFGDVTVAGDALDAFPGPDAEDPAVGEVAPTLMSQDFAGNDVTLGPDGKAHVVVFLAHWCPHCNAEAPRLLSAIDDGLPDDVVVDIVPSASTDLRENWPPSEWVADMGLAGQPTLLDDASGTAATAYGFTGFPFVALLDHDFQVVERASGEQPDGWFSDAFDRISGAG